MRSSFLLNALLACVAAALNVTDNSTEIHVSNERLSATWLKSLGSITDLSLDGRDLLGARSGSTGIGPYLG
jgi:rhamnogalacturonan endolyase